MLLKSETETLKKKCEQNLLIAKKILFLKERIINENKKSIIKNLICDLIDQDKINKKNYKDEAKTSALSLINQNQPKELKIPDFLSCRISFVI